MITAVSMHLIYPREGGRQVQRNAVQALAESMAAIGLKTPIVVRSTTRIVNGVDADAYEIVAGRHRYEAAIVLGWQEIPASIQFLDDADARMWEIAENLHRAELTVQERADQVAEWIRLAEAKGIPAQVAPVFQSKGGRGNEGGIRAAARELGVDRDAARRAVKIASIADDAKEAAREAGLDNNQSALLKVAAAPASDQKAVVHELVRQREDAKLINKAGDDLVKGQALTDAAEMLVNGFPASEMERLVERLDAAGLTALTKAIRRNMIGAAA